MLKSYLITFFISMVPIVELRGAIPYGTLLCNPPVPLLQAYIISIIGNMLPVPIIFFFALCCPAFVRRYPTSGHRRMDRYTGSLFP